MLQVKLGNRDPCVWVTVVTGICDGKPGVCGVPVALLVLSFCSLTWDVLPEQSLGLGTPGKEMPPHAVVC